MALDFSFIVADTTTSTASNGWSNRARAQFHYFNKNGLVAAKQAADKEIDALVDEGLAKSGAIIAYGGLNSYYYNRLRELVTKKKVDPIELSIVLRGLKDDIAKSKEFVEQQRSLHAAI